ncbi:glutamine amidotransferase [Nakamurella sp. PAMC28650]|uniref:glutamine amidotransferase n=1 Tax=Nakamurella sp. PAMC28650 TaxID=2762325 RepID=UPI00164D08B5|nr:glutamine amidotransferase [Nakamurella sp. PAMC28650]QNK82952.1 glutamine amidotransferase [Nakamurella sp. PAMC28650]
MCGIVGLHLRDRTLYPRLGEMLTDMLCEMQERGADSAGVAVYGDPTWSPVGRSTVSVVDSPVAAADLAMLVTALLAGPVPGVVTAGSVLLVNAPVAPDALVAAVRTAVPTALIVGYGRDLAVLKGMGHPRMLAESFGLRGAQDWQGVGHTRMATESAVDAAGSHPYAVGPDQCLVHNGSFANHATIRRRLEARGIAFESENDTEVGARFVAAALADGLDIETALKQLCVEFDGFYTLLVSSHDSFAVVRDAIACKPAIIAETDGWVAMASEYRALAGLPGVASARLYEPEPERIYAWTR